MAMSGKLYPQWLGTNTLMNNQNKIILIKASQIFGVLIWLPIRRYFTVGEFFINYFGVPIIISSLISLATGLILLTRMSFADAARWSTPAATVYFFAYMVFPLLPFFANNFSEEMSFFIINTLRTFGPITVLMLLANSLLVWLASIIRSSLFYK